ncbi:MAG: hypothetical protein CMK59_03780 [Proteobacteria bacterium]|nr:hypothetical protein [Pseudomonadota bacterium]
MINRPPDRSDQIEATATNKYSSLSQSNTQHLHQQTDKKFKDSSEIESSSKIDCKTKQSSLLTRNLYIEAAQNLKTFIKNTDLVEKKVKLNAKKPQKDSMNILDGNEQIDYSSINTPVYTLPFEHIPPRSILSTLAPRATKMTKKSDPTKNKSAITPRYRDCFASLTSADSSEVDAAFDSILFDRELAVPALIEKYMSKPSDDLRYFCVQLMGFSGSTTAVPTLLKALNDPSAEIRSEACLSLEDLNAYEYLNLIEERLQDLDETVRQIAQEVCINLKRSAKPITSQRKQKDPKVNETKSTDPTEAEIKSFDYASFESDDA